MRHSIFLTVALSASAALSVACSGEDKDFDNPVLQDLDGDGLGYFEDCDDTNAQIGQPDEGCAAGGICTDDSKCVSGVCDLSTPEVRGSQSFGRCARPSCDDNTLNGDETDVDCGAGCAPCGARKLCSSHGDCESETCIDGRCANTECGDGVVAGEEECDDGNRVNEDACTAQCTTARCGDGIRRTDITQGEAGYEACDDGNASNVDSCLNTCVSASCGDGHVGPGEACDDGNAVDTDGCRNTCREPACGDGILDVGEECDDGNAVDTDGCRTGCIIAMCGDGVVQVGIEECDEGRNNSNSPGATCRLNCRQPGCGDGVVDGGEECDDGNEVNDDGCTNLCTAPRCGDSIVQVGEACDDGNELDNDMCLNSCVAARCGDGVVQVGIEECDEGPGNSNRPGATCRLNCRQPWCGDGVIDGGEECDDGNEVNDDGCTNLCTAPRCGDSIVRVGEVCDDGNRLDNDMCLNSCVAARCGDGVVQVGIEECDAGEFNTSDCAYGQNACTVCTNDCVRAAGAIQVCGDGVRQQEFGEECDDGNDVDTDACRIGCVAAACGDGVVYAGVEECDGAAGCGADCNCADIRFAGVDCSECAPQFAGEMCAECAPHHFGPECVPAPCLADGACPDLDFVAITGGVFQMGANSNFIGEGPVHAVNIPNFQLLRNEVTVGQYRACVNAGRCDEPETGDGFNWSADAAGLENHPINGVSWHDANQFAEWIGARLPMESEWEYAARSQGQNITYPWGDDALNCDRLNFRDCEGDDGVHTSRICTHPAGNSSQGVCDLVGNVREWIEDHRHRSYVGAPDDGSAWLENEPGWNRVCRGGAWWDDYINVRAAARMFGRPENRTTGVGFRPARSQPAN